MTKKTQWRLVEITTMLDVNYDWVYYRLSTGQAPVQKKFAYSIKEVQALKEWLEKSGKLQPEKALS